MDRKTTATVVVTTLILAAIPLTVYLAQQEQKALTEAAPATTLSITSTNAKLNDTFALDVGINSSSNAVFGAQLEILFDPNILEARDAEPGDFLTNPQGIGTPNPNIDNVNGTVFYALGSTREPSQGTGVLAKIMFKAIGGGTTTIKFGARTSVAAVDEDEGLASTGEGAVTVADKGNMTFKIKFRGVGQNRGDRIVKVTLKKSGAVRATHNTVTIRADTNGVYEGTISDIPFDTYDVLIKGWAHPTKKFTNVSLRESNNSVDWSSTELKTGDADGDDEVDIQDFGLLAHYFLQEEDVADFNLSGFIDIQDFGLLAENFDHRGEN